MTDALDPRTQWVYGASRARTDSIELVEFYSWQVEEVVELVRPLTDAPGFTIDEERATDYIYSDPPNPLAKYLVRNQNPLPIRSILKSLLRNGKVSALVERPYLDLEFWDTHAGFYDKCFREHARHCERVHFFSMGALSQANNTSPDQCPRDLEIHLIKELRGLLYRGRSWKNILKAFEPHNGIQYLGYLVFRPTLSFSVGRAAIRFDNRSEEQLCKDFSCTVEDARKRVGSIPLEYGALAFLKTGHPCRANVLSTPLETETMEFMQQDPNLGACATVSLWVATRVMADGFGLNRFNYATITRQALGELSGSGETVVFDPTNLGEGLSSEEIASAIQRTGARSLCFRPEEGGPVNIESMRLQHEVYSFIESGIPVILCLGDDAVSEGHAVVVVGHSLPSFEVVEKKGFVRPAKTFMSDVAENHYLVSSLIPVYYAHDDAYGPFNRVVFHADGDKGVSKNTSPYPIVTRGGSQPQEMSLMSAVVPVPPMVHAGSTARLNELLQRFDKVVLKSLCEKFGKNLKLLWRSLLMEDAEFKASTVRRGYADEIIEWYGKMMLSKYVWLFEVTLIDEESHWHGQFAPQDKREILGEFIVDATTPSADFRCLAFRLREWGFDYRRDIETPDLKGFSESEEFPLDERSLLYDCYRDLDSLGVVGNGKEKEKP